MPESPHASDPTAIIPRLRAFLPGQCRGFCFEAASKRLTLDNEPFLVDLAFYRRPVGLLPGVQPAATQMSYFTPGASAELFVRQHHVLLPSEAELHALFEEKALHNRTSAVASF